ncbi:MAG: hypothetical protein LBV74_03845 [Tannerella sp.]|jgi:hypothetical protein|nr:hypothetical protein [Tannerella sp.]
MNIKKNQQPFFIGCICILYACILFTGCDRQQEKKEVDKAVMAFFSAYKQDSYREIDRRLFSDKLTKLLDQATEREKKEFDIVLKSDYPTDKPFMMDFDVFTSMPDGADSIRILQTTIKADTAWVNVVFGISDHNSKFEWNDQLVFIKNTTWKLDNVMYGEENTTIKNLQDLLEDYIHAENTY